MKLASLFDGSGGFPFAGFLSGITPVWASEVEPYPIAVSASHFPHMKHLGSVTDIDGSKVEPVDIITFGSPCQDLSIAGKQKGIHDGERSSLFFEAVRIIKEMRNATHGKYPRYAVWENVPGAFSSNKGRDFLTVLQTLIEACGGNPDDVPFPSNGKWLGAGEIVGDCCSVAWRVLDAQYWGVPQRRKRIYLVTDFTSQRAGEILFERTSLRGNLQPSHEAREGAATDAVGGSDAGDGAICFKERAGCTGGGKGILCGEERAFTLSTQLDQNACYPDIARTLNARHDSSPCIDRGQNLVCVRHAVAFRNGGFAEYITDDVTATLKASGGDLGGGSEGFVIDEVYPKVVGTLCASGAGLDRPSSNGNMLDFCITTGSYMQITPNVAPTLMARDYKDPSCACGASTRYIVRRLTPTECARLQGFPDEWGKLADADAIDVNFCRQVRLTKSLIDGKPIKEWTDEQMLTWYKKLYSESAEYKMWGNGIALPCAAAVLGGIASAEGGESHDPD